MNIVRLLLVVGWLGALTLGACRTRPGGDPAPTQDVDTLYTCSMHPHVIQDAPGSCPICGMDLTPMQNEPSGSDTEVSIRPGIVQQIGVETTPVQRTTVFRHLRTIGEVDVGEDEVSVVNLRFSGWVERINVDKTGDQVRAGQALFDIYSPELVAAQEEYLLALRRQGADAPLTKSARRKLELWNVAAYDLRQLEQAQEASRTVPIRAPQSGFVLHKDLVEGARVSAGQDLYRIGNLSRIWVTADVYEHDAPWVELGQPAQLELTHVAERSLQGTVSYIYPTLDADSRTLKVRLEFDNPGVRIKPGMFATVYIEYRRKDNVIAVPTQAVLHSGRRELVFVAKGRGRFEPREIGTGLRGDENLVEVTTGLEPGELVVTSGQFLLDSESQLQAALQKIRASSQEPRTPAPPPDAHAHHAHEEPHDHGVDDASAVYTCPMHPDVRSSEPGRCPDCGMFLEQEPPHHDAASAHATDAHAHGAHP